MVATNSCISSTLPRRPHTLFLEHSPGRRRLRQCSSSASAQRSLLGHPRLWCFLRHSSEQRLKLRAWCHRSNKSPKGGKSSKSVKSGLVYIFSETGVDFCDQHRKISKLKRRRRMWFNTQTCQQSCLTGSSSSRQTIHTSGSRKIQSAYASSAN